MSIEHLISNLLRVPRKTVHEPPPLLRPTPLRQLTRNLESSEIPQPLSGLLLLAHRNPSISNQHIGPLHRLLRNIGLHQLSRTLNPLASLLNNLQHLLGDLIPLRRSNSNINAHFPRTDRHIEKHVIRIAHPSDFQPIQPQTLQLPLARGSEMLTNSLKIRNSLQRVIRVTQGIDNRLSRVLGEVGDVSVLAHAGNDTFHHGGDDHGSVVEGFIDSQLDVVLAEEHGVAAHLDDGAFGGNAGAGAALAEHHGDGLAGEGAVEGLGDGAGFDGPLVGGGIADEGCEFGWGQVGDGEQVPRCEGRSCRRCGGVTGGGVEAAQGVAGCGRPVAGGCGRCAEGGGHCEFGRRD